MSLVVSLADLPAAIDTQIGWCYLLTVSDDAQPRVVAVAPTWNSDGALCVDVGKRTAANLLARPDVSMVWPPAESHGYSLIADGTATVEGLSVIFRPATAVLHRSAISEGTL